MTKDEMILTLVEGFNKRLHESTDSLIYSFYGEFLKQQEEEKIKNVHYEEKVKNFNKKMEGGKIDEV